MTFFLKRINCKVTHITAFVLLFFYSVSFGQTNFRDKLTSLQPAADSAVKTHPAEKIYMQTDKPNYAVGDTLWFKAYLFNAPTMNLSAKSGILYVDIANDSSTFIKQYRLPVKEGIIWGNISLSEFPAGNYTLRAYTNWMRNFGTDCFFYRRLIVAGDKEQTWLANSLTTTSVIDRQLQANVKLQLSDMNKIALADKLLQLEVMSGKHHLYKQQAQTDSKGQLDINFKVPEKASGLTLVAHNEGDKITIPINLNRAENIDVQFLPEGGNLVAGLSAHVAFKAIGEDGKGVNISGIVVDHNKKQAATFQSLHSGMGSFDLQVQPDEAYMAKVNLPGGIIKEYPLPAIKNTGIVLDVRNPFDKDSVTVSMTSTNDLQQSAESYFLIGKSRGIICYAAIMNFKSGAIRKNISKRLFPSGITHFVLTNTKGQPLNERMVFIDHHDDLHINIVADKPTYMAHDSVTMHIAVADSTGTPIAGNFSVAVTDDAQVKQDNLNNENILTRLLLTGDLKDYVEEPGYYLQTETNISWQALDNLLLTQGWVSYDWLADKQHPEFTAETEFEVKGQVQNGFNGAVKGTHVTLLSKSPLFVKDTTTDKTGHFTFKDFPVIDTPAFFIKAVNRHNKSFNVGITMDEVEPPLFTAFTGSTIQPWYISSDTALLNAAKNNHIRIEQKYTDPNTQLLKEVKITAKKVVKGSQNLNGPGNADLVLDEKDLIKEGKENWLQLFQEKIKGFRVGAFNGHVERDWTVNIFMHDLLGAIPPYPYSYTPINGFTTPWYFINDEPVKFIVDGISVGKVFLNPTFDDITNYLKSQSAEDIKGVEVNISSEYSYKYIPADFAVVLNPSEFSFIEITTRSGKGPAISNTPGTYLYKPLPLSAPKQFYKPKYTINDTTRHLPDTRSTIDWEPNIITDKNGKAAISFYAADKPGTYTIVIEGTDGNGNLGYKLEQINIVGKPVPNKQKADTR